MHTHVLQQCLTLACRVCSTSAWRDRNIAISCFYPPRDNPAITSSEPNFKATATSSSYPGKINNNAVGNGPMGSRQGSYLTFFFATKNLTSSSQQRWWISLRIPPGHSCKQRRISAPLQELRCRTHRKLVPVPSSKCGRDFLRTPTASLCLYERNCMVAVAKRTFCTLCAKGPKFVGAVLSKSKDTRTCIIKEVINRSTQWLSWSVLVKPKYGRLSCECVCICVLGA